MDITIQQPWFKRALGPFYPSRLFDQFFGEGLFEYDLLPFLSSTISPYYRQSLFRTVLDSGISEVRPPGGGRAGVAGGPAGMPEGCAPELLERMVSAAGPLSLAPVPPAAEAGGCPHSRASRASGEGSGEGACPSPTAVFSSISS